MPGTKAEFIQQLRTCPLAQIPNYILSGKLAGLCLIT